MNQQIHCSPYDRFWTFLVYRRRGPAGRFVRLLLRFAAIDIPVDVEIGANLKLLHVGTGHTLHARTHLGKGVVLGPGVVVGKRNLRGPAASTMRVVVEDDVVLGAGATVLASDDQFLTIGQGAQIGANAVVLKDVPCHETWAGNPARRVP